MLVILVGHPLVVFIGYFHTTPKLRMLCGQELSFCGCYAATKAYSWSDWLHINAIWVSVQLHKIQNMLCVTKNLKNPYFSVSSIFLAFLQILDYSKYYSQLWPPSPPKWNYFFANKKKIFFTKTPTQTFTTPEIHHPRSSPPQKFITPNIHHPLF